MATLRIVRRLAVLLLVAATLAGCRTKEAPPDATATTATALLPTTVQPTTTTIDVTASPTAAQMQDPAYWNAVLASLNHVVGDAYRSAVSTGKVDPATLDAVRQVVGDAIFPQMRKVLADIAAGTRNGMLVPPGDSQATVTRILSADSRCVALEAFVDFSKLNPTVPSVPNVVKLVPHAKPRGSRPMPPWMIDEQFIIDTPDDTTRLCAG